MLAIFEFASDPTAASNIARTVGESMGGVAGGLILGLIIWAPFRLIRGADKAPDVRRFTLYTAAVLVTAFTVFRFFVAQ